MTTKPARVSRSIKSAEIRAVLVLVGEPELLFLESGQQPLFAVAVDKEGMDRPFFACQVNSATARAYFSGRADLRYTFLRSLGRTYYFFDLAKAKGEVVSLTRANGDEQGDEDYWPAPGFFSRSHTAEFSYGAASQHASVVRRYFIDGRWSTADFSRYNSKMANLYGLFSIMRGASSQKEKEKQDLHEAIVSRAWEGGGSYVAFYNDMAQMLEVERINYASPGEIALRGDATILDEVDGVVDALDNHVHSLNEEYLHIYSRLRESKLLGIDSPEQFPSKALADYLIARSFKLGKDLGIQSLDALFDACRKREVLFTKIVLSIFRRSLDLYTFHAEGRVYNQPQRSHLERNIGTDLAVLQTPN